MPVIKLRFQFFKSKHYTENDDVGGTYIHAEKGRNRGTRFITINSASVPFYIDTNVYYTLKHYFLPISI